MQRFGPEDAALAPTTRPNPREAKLLTPTGLTRRSILTLAGHLAESHGYKPLAGLPGGKTSGPRSLAELKQLIAGLGGRLGDRLNGWLTLLINREGNFEIYLNPEIPETEQRYAMAQGLGHYLMHFLLPAAHDGLAPALVGPASDPRLIREAQWFADGFLMPEALLAEMIPHLHGDVARLAALFGVNQAALLRHALALELPVQYMMRHVRVASLAETADGREMLPCF